MASDADGRSSSIFIIVMTTTCATSAVTVDDQLRCPCGLTWVSMVTAGSLHSCVGGVASQGGGEMIHDCSGAVDMATQPGMGML